MEEQIQPQPAFDQQAPTSPIPVKQSNNFYLIIAVLVFLIMVGGLVYLGYQNYQLQQKINQILEEQTIEPQITTEQPTNPSPSPAGISIPGWRDYVISSIDLMFQYPPTLEVVTDINNMTSLAADEEYWVAVGESDVIYLDIFLYKSNKNPSDWWNTDGKNKFEALADEIESAMTPRPSVNLTYSVQPKTFVDKQTLEVTVSSNYASPHTPPQRYLTIFQRGGYVAMISYHDQGTTTPSMDISKQILSTFKLTN